MNDEKQFEDLFEFNLSDGTHVYAWTDGKVTFLQIRFVTLAIPNELFKELLKRLIQYHRSSKKSEAIV